MSRYVNQNTGGSHLCNFHQFFATLPITRALVEILLQSQIWEFCVTIPKVYVMWGPSENSFTKSVFFHISY